MWSHDKRTRGALHPSEGQSPVFAGVAEILRQTPLQIHEFDVRKQLAGRTTDARS